jgi:hypothetical protein
MRPNGGVPPGRSPIFDSPDWKWRAAHRFETISGDSAYDSWETCQKLRRHRIKPVIAHRETRQGEYPPEATGFDKTLYRRRNVVEHLIGCLKENRRIATRYEKLAES